MEKLTESGEAQPLVPRVSAGDLALLFFKRKWSVSAMMALTMLSFLFWLFVIHDDMYVVSTKILVKIGREQAAPPSVMGVTPQLVAYRSQDVNSELDIFQSSDSIARVVDELHLDQPVVEPTPAGFLPRSKSEVKRVMREIRDWYEGMLIRAGLRERLTPREKVIYGIQQGLNLHAQKDSNVFVASLVLPHRVGSARVLNALLDRYLELREKLYHNQDASFFRSAVDSSSAKLRDAEQRLQTFEDQGGISQLEKQESILIEHIASARSAWLEAYFIRQEFAGRVQRVQAELKRPDPELSGVAQFGNENFEQSVIRQLADLQRERERLRMTELDGGDRIQNNRQQFARLAGMLSANLGTALAEKEQQAGLRKAEYDNLQDRLKQLHTKQIGWRDLKRRTQDDETAHRLFRRKLDEAAADDAMQQHQIGNVAVIERANDPLAPGGMRKTTLMMLGALASLLAGLVWLTIAEFFDHGIYTAEALQLEIGAPVFATIPAGTRLLAARNAMDR
jgi:uncharacterized protein involved in exopolysaccharide biosynthesis